MEAVKIFAQFFKYIAALRFPVFAGEKTKRVNKERNVTDHARRKLPRPVRVA